MIQNGPEQVCNDEIGEISELVGDGIEVGDMLELVEDSVCFNVITLAWDEVDSLFCDDTETLMHTKSKQDCEAGVGEMLELDEYRIGLDAIEDASVARGDPVDCEDSETSMQDKSKQVGEADV